MKKPNETTDGLMAKNLQVYSENICGLISLSSDPSEVNNIELPGGLVRAYAIYENKLYYITRNPYYIEEALFKKNKTMNDINEKLVPKLTKEDKTGNPNILIQDLSEAQWKNMIEIIIPPQTEYQNAQIEVMKQKTKSIQEGTVKKKIKFFEKIDRQLTEEIKKISDKITQSKKDILKEREKIEENKSEITAILKKRCKNKPQLEGLKKQFERLNQCIKEKETLCDRIKKNIENEDRELKRLEEGESGEKSNYPSQLFPPVCSDNNIDYSIYITLNKVSELSQLLLSQPTRQEILNFKNSGGDTCLHLAVTFERAEIVELLVEHGADIYAKDNDGFMPVELDCNEEFKDIFDQARPQQRTLNGVLSQKRF